MDPRLAEEIKRRNKLKLQQWEDKLKIVGKFDKSDSSSETDAQQPVQQKPQMPFNELDSELTSMFDTMQGMQNAQNNQNVNITAQSKPAQQPVSQAPVQQTQEIKNQTQPVSKEDEALAKFDIGPFNIAAVNDAPVLAQTTATQSVPVNTKPHVTTTTQTGTQPFQQTAGQPHPTTTVSTTQPQATVAASVAQTPPVVSQVVEDENAKYLHIDIVEGKIKLARKNMSIEEAVSLLAKVYNSYKSKM